MILGHDDSTGRAFITELQFQPNDVLMGRGAPINDNSGNIRFLILVREKCSDYKRAATRRDKDAIARQIVSTIHARNGLFLRRIDSPEEELQLGVPPGVMAWAVVDEKIALVKIKQALRDRGLEAEKDHQAGQNASAAQVSSNMDDEELGLGLDAMVAHGINPREPPSPPLAKRARSDIAQQPPPIGHGGPASQQEVIHPALDPRRAISEPARLPGAAINRFQGAPDRIIQQLQEFPLQSNFSQRRIHPGTFLSQPSLEAPTPQLPLQGQDSTTHRAFASLLPAANTNFQFAGGNLATTGTTMNRAALRGAPPLPHRLHTGQGWETNAAAGLNLLPDTINAQLQQLEEEERLNAYFRTGAFPQDATTELQMKGGELKNDDRKLAAKSNNNNDTSGEIALQIACDVCEMGQTPIGGVKLDPIEFCLLSVLISRGLPTWSSTQFRNGEICTSHTTPCPFTWTNVGNHLTQEVQMFLSRKTSMLLSSNVAENQQQRSATEGFVSRLVSLTAAYSNNPTNLARMAVCLLEKLRLQGAGQFASNPAAAPASSSPTPASMIFPGQNSFGRSASMISDNQRGSLAGRTRLAAMGGGTDQADSPYGTQQLLQTFLSKELGQWATSLKVADDGGFPVPCSSRDFVVNFPQLSQNDVFSTAASLYASGCLDVLSQVSLLTRLRLISQNNSSDQMISILRTSLAPQWGTSIEETASIDMSLLQSLLVNGFSGLMDRFANSDDLLGILLRHTSITKIDVEKRAVQLTCLLHQHVHSRRLNQIVIEQGARILEMIGL